MSDVRSRISTSNISETGTGKLRYLQIQDTISSGSYDATIGVNVDGEGVQTLSLNTMFKSNSSSTGGKTQYISTSVSDGQPDIINIPFELSYRSSLAVTVSNSDGFFIVWDEEVF